VDKLVTFSPPFRDHFTPEDIGEMRDLIAEHQPDVLWMGLSAPKQEVLLHELAQYRDFRFAAAIGAAFDFYAGNVQRSAPIFRKLGLEWLPRLVQQPRRLWRRMFISAPMFLADVIAEWIRRVGSRKPG
jgi:N-acetylglucosaminyldiphosphoundecaprenol N-acetyl-beta-D-mannosaminyltransferase